MKRLRFPNICIVFLMPESRKLINLKKSYLYLKSPVSQMFVFSQICKLFRWNCYKVSKKRGKLQLLILWSKIIRTFSVLDFAPFRRKINSDVFVWNISICQEEPNGFTDNFDGEVAKFIFSWHFLGKELLQEWFDLVIPEKVYHSAYFPGYICGFWEKQSKYCLFFLMPVKRWTISIISKAHAYRDISPIEILWT